jgi:assimilatory nitrate reductase catalytic subunit
VGRDLDIGGLSYALLEAPARSNGRCAPAPRPARRACMPTACSPPPAAAPASQATQHRRLAEATDPRHPLHLNTGRLRDQWHGMSRSGMVPRLHAHAPEPAIEMHPRDMERRGIADGDLVRLKGKRGSLLLRAAASNTLRPAQTYVPMHWGGQFMSGLGVNALTLPATTRYRASPSSSTRRCRWKNSPPAGNWWPCAATMRVPARRLAALAGALRPCHADPGRARVHVVVLRAWGGADTPSPTPELLAELAAAMGLDGPQCWPSTTPGAASPSAP